MYVFSVVFVGIKNVHVNQWDALLDTLVFGQRFFNDGRSPLRRSVLHFNTSTQSYQLLIISKSVKAQRYSQFLSPSRYQDRKIIDT